NTLFEAPGKHALVAGLELNDQAQDAPEIVGPYTVLVVSNLCQFSSTSASFDPETGAILHLKLPEPRATYVIDLSTPSGDRLKIFSASTSNAIIKEHWTLLDERGPHFRGNAFDTFSPLTLPPSGRSRAFRGP